MSSRARPRDWNAGSYHEVSAPHQEWGAEVLGRLELSGDETVLDLGCGTGRVTAMLLARLPRGHVLAVDGSPSMVARARAELDQDRATVVCCDLLELHVEQPADAAISTAAFHWILDHDLLFARVHDALVPGAKFVAQCGGEGNIASVTRVLNEVGNSEPFAAFLGGWQGASYFATPEATAARLLRAGFDVERCWLREHPVTPERPREYLETVILGAHLERLPAGLRDEFVDRVLGELPDRPTLDYVRLNIVAQRR